MDIQTFVQTLIGYERIKVHGFEIETEQYHGETIFVAKVELNDEDQYRCPECNAKTGNTAIRKSA